jgi:uncharacterized protein
MGFGAGRASTHPTADQTRIHQSAIEEQTIMAKGHGMFVWYDVMTSEPKPAEAFYRDVVGWNAQDAGMGDRCYTILSTGQTMIGGLMPIPEDLRKAGHPSAWTGYIGVDDVDGYAKRLKAAGGTIHREPDDIPGTGRFAAVADPHGAGFIIFKGASDQTPTQAPMGTPGHIGWRELHAGNGEQAFAFYSELFGWTKAEALDMGPMGSYQIFAIDGVPSGGMMTRMPQTPAPFWLYYFTVEAVDAATARVKNGGGKVVNGPMEVPGGHFIVQCFDPRGRDVRAGRSETVSQL